MKRWLPAIGALLLLMLAQVPGAAAEDGETGSIAGRVLDGTQGGTPVAGQDVVLQGVRHSDEATILPVQVTQTDPQGNFRFDGLPVSEENSFLVFVTYDNVEYGSKDVKLTAEEPSADLEMEVYGSTTADDQIRVSLDHIVIEADAQAQVLSVLEVFQVLNEGDRAYVGESDNTDSSPTLQLSLPEGATQVSVISGVTSQNLVPSAAGLADTTPVVPGEKEVALGYELPYAESELLLQKTLYYPTDRLAILVQDAGFTIDSPALSAPQPTDMGEERYLLLTGESLAAGQSIEVSLSDLPTASSSGGRPDVLWPLMGAGLAVALGMAVLYPRLRRRLRRPESDEQHWASGDQP